MKQLCLFLVYTVGCVLFPVSCKNGNIVRNQEEYIPDAPVYSDTAMWFTVPEDASGEGADVFYVVSTWELDWKTDDVRTSHYADVWSAEPWLYSGCLSENVANRVSLWYLSGSDSVTGK